jgi:hypothetical protein
MAGVRCAGHRIPLRVSPVCPRLRAQARHSFFPATGVRHGITAGQRRAGHPGTSPAGRQSVNRSRKRSLLTLPKYFGKLYRLPNLLRNIMKKMIAAVLAGLFAAVTASSIVVAAEPKKDDAKKTEKKADKK